VSRLLQVVRKSGASVTGTGIELVRPMTDEPVDVSTPVVEIQTLRDVHVDKAGILLQRGDTDARGELQLRGPPREKLALRILGPGHQPLVLQEVFLDPALGPLRVDVPDGATLSGRARPIEALRQFHPPPDVVARQGKNGGATLGGMLPGLCLVRSGSSSWKVNHGRSSWTSHTSCAGASREECS
jgi:hypothetical protein